MRDRPHHDSAKALILGEVSFYLERLLVVVGDLVVIIPNNRLDRRFLVKDGLETKRFNEAINLRVPDDADLVTTRLGRRSGAVLAAGAGAA